MKPIQTTVLSLTLLLSFALGCRDHKARSEKEFPHVVFDAWRNPRQDTIYLREEVPVGLEIRHAGKQIDSGFHLSAKLSRKGRLCHRAGATLEGDWKVDHSEEISLVFKPLETGRHVLYFDVVDAHEQRERDSVVFYVKKPPFSLHFGAVQKRIYKGHGVESIIVLKNRSNRGRMHYRYRYFDESDGALFIGDKRVRAQRPQSIQPGVYTLRARYTDVFGDAFTTGEKLSVEKNRIRLSLEPARARVYSGERNTLALTASPAYKGPSQYEVKYNLSARGQIEVGGKRVKQGVFSPLDSLQKTLRVRAAPEVLGGLSLEATVRERGNPWGTASLSKRFEVVENQVKVRVTPRYNDIPTDIRNPIKVSISPSWAGGRYEIRYSFLHGRGTLFRGGHAIKPGEFTALDSSEFEQEIAFQPFGEFTSSLALKVAVRDVYTGRICSGDAYWQVGDNRVSLTITTGERSVYKRSHELRIEVVSNFNKDIKRYEIRYDKKGKGGVIGLRRADGTALPMGRFIPLKRFDHRVEVQLDETYRDEAGIDVVVRENQYNHKSATDASFQVVPLFEWNFKRKPLSVISAGQPLHIEVHFGNPEASEDCRWKYSSSCFTGDLSLGEGSIFLYRSNLCTARSRSRTLVCV